MHITKKTHYNSVRRNVPKNFGTMMGYCIDQIGTWRPANSYIESWTQFRFSLCVLFLSIPLGYSVFFLSMPLGYTNCNWVGSMTRWYFCSQVQKKKSLRDRLCQNYLPLIKGHYQKHFLYRYMSTGIINLKLKIFY